MISTPRRHTSFGTFDIRARTSSTDYQSKEIPYSRKTRSEASGHRQPSAFLRRVNLFLFLSRSDARRDTHDLLNVLKCLSDHAYLSELKKKK